MEALKQRVFERFGIGVGTMLLYHNETFEKIEGELGKQEYDRKELIVSIASDCYTESHLFKYLEERIEKFKLDFFGWKNLLEYSKNSQTITRIILSKMYDTGKSFEQYKTLEELAKNLGFENISKKARSSKELILEKMSNEPENLVLVLSQTRDDSSLRLTTILQMRNCFEIP
jgi:hypothetical protein